MAEEEKKETKGAPVSAGGERNILRDIGEGLIDGIAQKNPILGIPLQAAFNTPDYQDRQMRRQMNKLAFAHAQAKQEEWEKGSGARAAQQEAEEMRAKEYTAAAGDREDARALARRKLALENKRMDAAEENLPDEAALKKAQTQLAISKTNLAQDQADAVYKQQAQSGYDEGLKKDLAQYPAFATMSFPEQNDTLSSPGLQNLKDMEFYAGQVMEIGQKNPQAFGYMARLLRKHGFDLVDGKDVEDGEEGVKYLVGKDQNGTEFKIPATREGLAFIRRMAVNQALEEINTRGAISDAATMGDPVKMSISKWTKALMPYNGNDATKSYRMLEGVYDKASEEEQGWHMFNQAITDYRSSGVPVAAKMDELKKCLPFLRKMGYTIQGFDEKNPNIEALTVLKPGEKQMNFSEFADLCREKDSLGVRLGDMVSDAKRSAIAQDRALFAREVGETQQALREQRLENGGRRGGTDKNGGKRKGTEGTGNSDDWFSSEHGENWKNAPEKVKRKMRENAKLYEQGEKAVLKQYGVDSVEKLPREAREKLDQLYKVLNNQ